MSIDELQNELRVVLPLNEAGSSRRHVLVAMPSFGLGESTLAHYAERIPALEHRYLDAITLLSRIEDCELIYLCSIARSAEIIEYYLSLIPTEVRVSARERFHIVSIEDPSAKSLARKLIDRPATLARIRALIDNRPCFIEPWNVTEHEVAVAEALNAPINGTLPNLWPIGFKSCGRRLFKDLHVPVPFGFEDLRSVEDLRAAIEEIRAARPHADGVVIKHDNSGSGDGNVVVRFRRDSRSLEDQLQALPEWYLKDLAAGGVVEELLAGRVFSSPSAQVDIRPDGSVIVLATHEQILGGPDAQIYQGCSFPADSAYAPEIAQYAHTIGQRLSAMGVIGRFSVDYVATKDEADWRVFALEVNLRKGGTTHPYAALRNLVPGNYDSHRGVWIANGGGSRFYHSTDNVADPTWRGLPPDRIISAVKEAGLEFDSTTGMGVVLHMLSCLAIDGRFGLTSIGRTKAEAFELSLATESLVRQLAVER